ncbi:hypothetical protein ALC60_07631, partial [Trachymyrmex zeteki]
IDNYIKQDCRAALLEILRRKCMPDLPKTAKTFLKTMSAEYYIENIFEVDDGQFVYFGITKYLQTMININLHVENIIELLINIDGEIAIKYNDHAKLFLYYFVTVMRQLYGEESRVLNTHSLVHLTDDAINMRCSLSEITAFPFENVLGKIKSLIRSGNRPLAQLCRRIHERFFISEEKITLPLSVEILKQSSICIKKIRYKNFIITIKSPNNTIILINGKILQINSIYTHSDENEIQISEIILRIIKPIFEYPCNSKSLKMWRVKKSNTIITQPLTNVLQKMVTFVLNNNNNQEKIYVMPLLHV